MRKEPNGKVHKLVRMASLKPAFQQEVKQFRASFNLPPGGQTSETEVLKWFKENDRILNVMAFWKKETACGRKGEIGTGDYIDEEYRILKKFNLPFTGREILESLLVSDGKIVFKTSAECEIEVPSLEEYRDRGQKFLRLVIYDHLSEGEVKAYLTREWRSIRKTLGSKSQRVRRTKYQARDSLIYDLWNHSRKALGMTSENHYKDVFIATKLKEEYRLDVSSDNIRRIVSKERKLRL
jgi:hypothetical protein